MRKLVPIGLFILLVYHTLAYVLVCVGSWWQAEHDLSERLMVYRSVDSIVEFQIPLINKTDGSAISRTTEDGFKYNGHYYSVVSLEIRDGILYIAGLQDKSHSFWQDDLLTFLNDHLATTPDTQRKANQLLKLLLKEYSPNPGTVIRFLGYFWRQSIRIPDAPFTFSTRSEPLYSPPPEWAA